MPQVAILFLQHFRQLNVVAILAEPCDKSDIYVNNEDNIVIKNYQLQVLPRHCFTFEPSPIRSFSIKESGQKYEVEFDIECSSFQPLESFDRDSCSIPPSEIVNDWIFCHRHQHQHCQSEDLQVKEENSRKIESLDQIRLLFASKSHFDRILIESSHTKDHMFFEIVDPEITVGSNLDVKDNRTNFIELRKATVVDYKYLTWESNQNEIKKFRGCFLTDWYLVDPTLFNDLLGSLKLNDLPTFRLDSSEKRDFRQAFL